MRKYLPPLILFFLLLIGWQALALGINAAYILPTPIQVIQKLWELREPPYPLSAGHRLPDDPDNSHCTAVCSLVRLFHLEQSSGNSTDDLFPDHHHGL